MDNSVAKVSSKELIALQSQLLKLSADIEEVSNAVEYGLKNLAENWRDNKYEEFKTEFQVVQNRIVEIAEKYKNWANQYLPPRIEGVQKAENLNMS
jgi:hypothetical protein